MRGGMLSDARPLNRAQAPAYAGWQALQQGFNYPCGRDTQVHEASTSANCISYTSSSSSFQGGPLDRANQAGQCRLQCNHPSFNSAGIGEHAATYMLITALVHSDL